MVERRPHVEMFDRVDLLADHSPEPIAVVFTPRYPCVSRARRAAMSDEEFWQDVSVSVLGGATFADMEHDWLDELGCIGIDSPIPCPECGATTACGYDQEGRPMNHVIQEDDNG